MKIFVQHNFLDAAHGGVPVIILKYTKIQWSPLSLIHETRFSLGGTHICIKHKEQKAILEQEYALLTSSYFEVASYYETFVPNCKRPQAECIGAALTIAVACGAAKDRQGLCDISYEIVRRYTSSVNILSQHDLLRSIVLEKGFTVDNGSNGSEKNPVKSAPNDSANVPEPGKGSPIQGILYNPEKKVVVVSFKDGAKVVKHCHEEDEFDVGVGVALAIVKHMFGTTTNYKRYLKRKAKRVSDKRKSK